MIAKGHDFQGVTLVGVVSVDAGLALPDFRAAERTFQLLAQAAGRAGRGSAPGRVLVQTFYPDHYAVRFAAQQNFEAFFEKEIRFRRTMHYPPVTAFANVVAQDADLAQAAKVARKVEEFFQTVEKPTPEVRVLGPAPAPLARLEGKYRLQFLLRSKSRSTRSRSPAASEQFAQLVSGLIPERAIAPISCTSTVVTVACHNQAHVRADAVRTLRLTTCRPWRASPFRIA